MSPVRAAAATSCTSTRAPPGRLAHGRALRRARGDRHLHGRNDSGLFELNFRDERHLPFEFFGAVSCWRIELPPENNYFDMDSLTDVILHLNYTAREGGDVLRDAARATARRKLPGNGWILLDLPKEFPDAWHLFRRPTGDQDGERSMRLEVTLQAVPVPAGEAGSQRSPSWPCSSRRRSRRPKPCPDIRGCPCAHDDIPGSHLVEVTVDHADDHRDDCDEVEIFCVSSADWPNVYQGIGEIDLAPIDRCHECHYLTLTFRGQPCALERAFLLLRYEVIEECCATMRRPVREGYVC